MNGTNLPTQVGTDSTVEVRQFFDKFFAQEVSFPAAQIDAVVGFFEENGFDVTSAKSTAIVLLNQARADSVNVFELLDTLKKLPAVQLSQIVAQVLNSYRESTSLLGYRIAPLTDIYETRNILV
jgi:hypothetical protein